MGTMRPPNLPLPLCAAALAAALLAPAAGAAAQTRPLRTVDPAPAPEGALVIATGAEFQRDRTFPLSGLFGDLVGLPLVSLTFGFGRAEFRVESGYDILWIDERDPGAAFADMVVVDGDVTSDIRDPVVSTKVLLRHETPSQPAVALRVATKFPAASNDAGLGTDAIDVYLTLLAGKDLGATRLAANLGLGVLSAPTEGHRQNDVLQYGLSAFRRVGERLQVVAEVAGREDYKGRGLPGTGEEGQARLGLRWTAGRWRFDGAAIRGLNASDASWGATVGVTITMQTFENR